LQQPRDDVLGLVNLKASAHVIVRRRCGTDRALPPGDLDVIGFSGETCARHAEVVEWRNRHGPQTMAIGARPRRAGIAGRP